MANSIVASMPYRELLEGDILESFVLGKMIGTLEAVKSREPKSGMTCGACNTSQWNAFNGVCLVHVCPHTPVVLGFTSKGPPKDFTGLVLFRRWKTTHEGSKEKE